LLVAFAGSFPPFFFMCECHVILFLSSNVMYVNIHHFCRRYRLKLLCISSSRAAGAIATLWMYVLFLEPRTARCQKFLHFPPNLPGQGVAENKVGSQGVMPRGQGSVGGASAATLGAGGLGGGGSQGEPPNAWGPGAGQGPWFYFVNFTKLVQFCLYLCHTFSYFNVSQYSFIVIVYSFSMFAYTLFNISVKTLPLTYFLLW